MKNSENGEIKNKNQVLLFDLIEKSIPASVSMANKISGLFGFELDAAYRRIRGDKSISFEEAIKLCKHFKISFDMLTGDKSINQLDCIYSPINLYIPGGYLNYITNLSATLGKMKNTGDANMIVSAIDIPLFHSLPYKELTFFKLYVWSHNAHNYNERFDDFMKNIETPEIIELQQKVGKDYECINSTEIWTDRTVNNILWLIEYYTGIGIFPDKDLPLLICEQVLSILNKLQKWTENSSKSDPQTPFKLHKSEIDFAGTYVLMEQSGQSRCIVRMFSINNLIVLDNEFCTEAKNYLEKLSERSLLLSKNSEKERINFFKSQREKVELLMKKIKK